MSKTYLAITFASLTTTAAWGGEPTTITTATTLYSEAGMRHLVAWQTHTARCRLQAQTRRCTTSLQPSSDLNIWDRNEAAARASELVSVASLERGCRSEIELPP